LSKNFWRGCRDCNLRGQSSVLTNKKFFFEKKNFSTVFRMWAKSFQQFVEKILAAFLKLHSRCPQEQFDQRKLFKKQSCFSYNFRTLSNNFLVFCPNFFGGNAKLDCYISKEIILKKFDLFLEKTYPFSFVLDTERIKFGFEQKIFGGFVKTALYVSEGSFSVSFFQKNIKFLSFSDI